MCSAIENCPTNYDPVATQKCKEIVVKVEIRNEVCADSCRKNLRYKSGACSRGYPYRCYCFNNLKDSC